MMQLPDLTARAGLAIHCMTKHCDPSRGNIPYFYTRLSDRPLSSVLTIWSYGDGLGRAVDAVTLLRSMRGESIDQPEDRAMRAMLIGLMGVDGLSWCPPEPWTTINVPHTRPAWLQQGTLLGLTSLYASTGDEQYRKLAETLIDAVAAMATPNTEHGDLEFPGDVYTRRDGWSPRSNDPMHRFSSFNTSVTMPLMRYYRMTGYEPALKLATGLMNWAIRDHGGLDGLFEQGHFHSYSRLQTAMALWGITTGDKDKLATAEQIDHKSRALGTSAGWFPEQINNPDHNRSNLSETCCLTDMIETATLLAQHVDPVYWNDVERYARNYLMVHQIVDTDWFAEMTFVPRAQHVLGFNLETRDGDDGQVTGDDLKASLIGGFAGWGAVTAMSDDSMFSNSNQQCCNAAGGRALYDAWRYSVTDDGTAFRVNLHLAREHAAASVAIAEDRQAELTVTMREARRLAVRIPEFVEAGGIKVTCNGQPRKSADLAGFLSVGDVGRGDVVNLTWPLKERTTTEKIHPGEFTYHWRGATVVAAEPVQKIRPLFVDARFGEKGERTPFVQREIDSI